jgi:hypothetical protein
MRCVSCGFSDCRIDNSYSLEISLYGESPGTRVDAAICIVCCREAAGGDLNRIALVRYCPSCRDIYVSSEGWSTSSSRVEPCPTHSSDPATPAMSCCIPGCGNTRIVRNLTASMVDGRLYCAAHQGTFSRCTAMYCRRGIHALNHETFHRIGGDLFCRSCWIPSVPRWFPVPIPNDWDYRASCSCRSCGYLANKSPLWPRSQSLEGLDSTCDSCGDTAMQIHLTSVRQGDDDGEDNERLLCHTCMTTDVEECEGCHELVTRNVLTADYSRCLRCLNQNYWYCYESCQHWFLNGTDCRCSGVRPWNYVPSREEMQWLVSSNERAVPRSPDFPYMGFELEIECPRGCVRKDAAQLLKTLVTWAYPVHDGTLADRGNGGIEIVSYPFTFGWFTQHWHQIKSLLNTFREAGYRSWESPRCGMHVHISRTPMTDGHQKKFIDFIYGHRNLCVAVGQRGYKSGIQRFAPFHREDPADTLQKVRTFRNIGTEGHYAALNANKRDTLEARWFRGTLSPLGFRKNVEFVHSVWTFTRKFGFASANEYNYIQWLRGVPERRDYATLLNFLERHYVTRR